MLRWFTGESLGGTLAGTVMALAFLASSCSDPERAVPTQETRHQANQSDEPLPPIASWRVLPPAGFGFGYGSVWLAGGGELRRIDPETNEAIATIKIENPESPPFLALGSLWVPTADGTVRIDPRSNRILGKVTAGRVYGFGSFWDTDPSGGVIRVDPRTGEVEAEVPIHGGSDWESQLAVGFGSVWVGSGDDHAVYQIDPATDEVVSTVGGISKDYSLLVVGVGFGSVWAHANAAEGDGILYRIDRQTARITDTITIDTGEGGQYGGTEIGFGGGSVWTGNPSGSVSRIDPRTNEVVATQRTLSSPLHVAYGFGSLWIDSEFDLVAVRLDAAQFIAETG